MTDQGRVLTPPTYQPWSKWTRRRVHLRWWVADLFHGIGYRIGGDL